MSRNWKIEQINNIPPKKHSFSKGWKSVRWHMEIESFGVNAVTKAKGEWLTPIHDETDDNQDELFVVLEGIAEFRLDDEKIKVPAGTAVSAKPSVKRGALAVETPTSLLIIGAPIGKVYKPSDWA